MPQTIVDLLQTIDIDCDVGNIFHRLMFKFLNVNLVGIAVDKPSETVTEGSIVQLVVALNDDEDTYRKNDEEDDKKDDKIEEESGIGRNAVIDVVSDHQKPAQAWCR